MYANVTARFNFQSALKVLKSLGHAPIFPKRILRQVHKLINIYSFFTLGTAIVHLLALGLQSGSFSSRSMSHLWALGFGKVTAESLLGSSLPLLITILVANLPQIFLSCFYLTNNGLLTSMLLAEEWSQFAHQRKTLRVTSPRGKQRSTYRLQLPYAYGIPLLVVFGCLHWLVSQSLFLARVDVYNVSDQLDKSESISTLGYSVIAIILVLILGAVIAILMVATSFRKYKPGMPLVGSRSAAISAACHPPNEDVHASMRRVKWGAVATETQNERRELVGHCTLTSFQVHTPIEGRLYAGQ